MDAIRGIRSASPCFARLTLTRYCLALLTIEIALLIRQPFYRLLGSEAPLLLFFIAVLVTARFAGLGPGLLATALGGLATYGLPPATLDLVALGLPARMVAVILEGLVLVRLNDALNSAELEARDAARRLQASEEQYRRIVHTATEGVWLIGADMRTIYANERMAQMLGCSVEEMIDRSPFEYAYEVNRVAAELLLDAKEKNTIRQWDLRFRRRDGSELIAVASASLILDDRGELLGVLTMVTDVTELKRAEERCNQLLCQEQAARRELEGALDAVRQADQHKDEFLAMLGHELRNPLAAMSNSLALLRSEDAGHAIQHRAVEVMARQLQQQFRLVDDLLDVSRITRGKISLRRAPLDLSQLLAETVEDLRESVERAGLTLRIEICPDSAWISGDRVRLSQVISNLVLNAAKFTPPAGQVIVRLEVSAADQRARVIVVDSGIGFDPALMPRLFEPFVQADRSLDRTRGGVGLGLALVKGVVELHGGSVSGQSEGLGSGASFSFELPLIPTPVESAAQLEGPALAMPSRSVLVIEDNRDAAETLRDLLEMDGHQVELAYDGPAGVQAARQHHPEIILCDLGLPGMDGYAVASELRKDPHTCTALLVAVSGYTADEDRRRSRRAGFDVHLPKPLDFPELERLLTTAQ